MKLSDFSSNISLVEEIMRKTNEEIEKMPNVNILVAGKTGVGKSTLINALFRENLASTGVGKPVTAHLMKITKEGVPIALYDTRGLELSPTVQKQVKEEMTQVYEETVGTPEQIYVTYYCISAGSNRIEELEIDLIKDLSEKMPVILVLTQSIGKPAEDFRQTLEAMNLPVVDILKIMATDYEVTDEIIIPPSGLIELIELTLQVIPEDAERAFNNAQHADIARKAKAARRWARRYIAGAFGVGMTPIPFADATVLVPMQVTMIAHITAIFGIALDKSTLLSIIAAVFGTSGATTAGRSIVTNLLKFIPGAGTIAGGAISGTTAAIVTSALAVSYIEVLTVVSKTEKDGKAPDLSNIQELMKGKFQDQLKIQSKKTEQGEALDLSEVDPKTDMKNQSSEGSRKGLSRFKGIFKR